NNNLKTYIDDTDCKLENVVAEIIKRRPSTLEDLKSATGFQNSTIETFLKKLEETNPFLDIEIKNGYKFYFLKQK
nr:hypothetical protein [Candidatus Dependentiae bacterium]